MVEHATERKIQSTFIQTEPHESRGAAKTDFFGRLQQFMEQHEHSWVFVRCAPTCIDHDEFDGPTRYVVSARFATEQ